MRIFGSPFRYVQSAGIIEYIIDIIAPLGDNFLLVADRMVADPIGNQISNSLHQSHMHCILIPFAGIGDAMATKFEAEACAASKSHNYFEGQVTQTALAMANLSWEIVKNKAVDAMEAVHSGDVNQAFEDVVEATILLSGLGFENGGLAAAHALSSGFTVLNQTKGALHGELVAFGLLVQFILEERSQPFMNEMLAFYQEIGLPSTLAELGIDSLIPELLAPVIETICAPDSTAKNMPFNVLPEMVERAILKANDLGMALNV